MRWIAVGCLALLFAAGADARAISAHHAKAFDVKLASTGPRPAGSANERRAARLVAKRLRRLGYAVAVQTFSLPGGGTSRNVVGRTSRPTRVLLGAHMDSVRAGPGANDNGSGVATILEAARALRDEPGVAIVAFGAEERVVTGSSIHLGSQRFVRSVSRRGRGRLRLSLVLDMVGVGTSLHVRGLEASPNRSARRALRRADTLGIDASYLRDPSGQSDHAELTRAGIPAAWLEWREDACWHEACDRAGRVRGPKLARAARIAASAARHALARLHRPV